MGCLAEAPSLPADAQPLQAPVLRCKRLTDPCLFMITGHVTWLYAFDIAHDMLTG